MKSIKSLVTGMCVGVSVATLVVAETNAGVITAVGSVSALTDVSQLGTIVGTGDFDEGPTTGPIPLNAYSGAGMTLHTGSLSSILAGVTESGTATGPAYGIDVGFFPVPIAGGGSQSGQIAFNAGVATFSVPVTQFGLTFSRNGGQYITAWNSSGALIGQVHWNPILDSAFVGIDTHGVPIAMLAVGNDDVFGGASYNIGGASIITDSWKWAAASLPEPSALAIFGLGLAGLGIMRRRRRVV